MCAGAWGNELQMGNIQEAGESAVIFAKIEKEHVWRLRDRRRDDWKKQSQEWYSGTGYKLYAWVERKSKWNADLEHVATGADGTGTRGTDGNPDLNYFGDPVEIQAKVEKHGEASGRRPKPGGTIGKP